MRRDQLLFQAIDQDREYEATESGCCVRRDGSGCVQVPSEADCPVTVSAIIYIGYYNNYAAHKFSSKLAHAYMLIHS